MKTIPFHFSLIRNSLPTVIRHVHGAPNQGGYALVFALIILMILTILGVTILNMNALEFRMAGNTQELVRSQQVAESGLRQAIVDEVTYNEIDDIKYLNSPKTLSNGPIAVGTSSASLVGAIGCWRCKPPRSKNLSDIESARADKSEVSFTTFQIYAKGVTPFGAQSQTMQNITKKLK